MSNILRVIISDASSNEGNATGEITTTTAPETGSFTGEKNNLTSGQASLNGFFIAIAIIIFAFVLGIGVILSRRAKIHRLRKTEVNNINHFKINARIKKVGLYGLAFIVLFGTLGLLFSWLLRIQKEARATGLSITTEDTTIVIERDGGPVFATASSTVTINEATTHGYILGISVLGGDNALSLVGGAGKIDSLEPISGVGYGKILRPNTYGLLADKENFVYIANSKKEYNQPIWGGIPVQDEENTSFIIQAIHSSSQVGYTETVDFGVYVDETIPAGVYEAEIEYIVTKIPAKTLEDAYKTYGKTKYNGYYAMQDMDSYICNYVDEKESQLQVIDRRDDRVYTIAKLKDGYCWMTENLDLAGGTELYSDDSNVPDGYARADGVPYFTLPESSEEGFNNNMTPFVYNTPYNQENRTECGGPHPCYSYYSWLAATARNVNELVGSGEYHEASYSICPKGWRLPKAGLSSVNQYNNPTSYSRGDYYRLAFYYGSGAQFVESAGSGTVANFGFARYYNSNGFFGGYPNTNNNSSLYTSSSYGEFQPRVFLVIYDDFNSAYNTLFGSGTQIEYGNPVRCIAIK